MLKEYVKIRGALRTKKYKEVLDDNISKKDGEKVELLNAATVVIESGKEFYADATSRLDLSDAIAIAGETGQTEVQWKLASEFEGSKLSICPLAELQEARLLALAYKGTVVGA